jgi:hypothetical protein
MLDLVLDLSRELRALKEFVRYESRKLSERIADEWIDGEQVMTILKISKRTLQSLRDNGAMPYSKINGKFYYKATDLIGMLEANYLNKGRSKQ